jgi:curved DNA-binding protein CbpA
VRQAYIDRALRHHPDRQGPADRADAEQRMQAVNAAWAVLGDREARAAYDAELGLVRAPEAVVVEEPPAAVVAPGGFRRFVPILVVLGLAVAFLVFTAYAGPAPS